MNTSDYRVFKDNSTARLSRVPIEMTGTMVSRFSGGGDRTTMTKLAFKLITRPSERYE